LENILGKFRKFGPRGRQMTGGHSVLLVLTKGRDVSRSANAYWLDIANFPYPLSFSVLVWGDPF